MKIYQRIKRLRSFMMSISGEIKTKWGTAKLDKGGYYEIHL